ncbi:MAG: hypothetical protein KDI71_16920 [Xanthomonadales bacterium]|nr:hypothetical protein [Xanthomonadales bacterium]
MKQRLGFFCGIATTLFLAGCGTDWRASAIDDEDFAYRAIRDGHPAMVDPENPDFATKLEAAHKLAANLASKVDDPGGYFYALRAQTVGFEDEHLSVGFFQYLDRPRAWPGFAVALDGDAFVVARRDSDAAPPAGARLVSCDDQSVSEMVTERIRPFLGNWSLTGKRSGDAPYLLADTGNPFVQPPQHCRFESEQGLKDYPLNWEPLEREAFLAIFGEFEPAVETSTGIRTLEDGSLWIGVNSFDLFNPQQKQALENLGRTLLDQATQLQQAPTVVIDVRDNRGGSSEAGLDLASAIWGADYVRAMQPRIERVDWRASAANLASLQTILPRLREALGEQHPTVLRMQSLEQGMQQAQQSGRNYFSEPVDYPGGDPDAAPALQRRIFLLTNHACVSACLDFLDLILPIPGVIQVGAETSGDTRYLEVVTRTLPSEIGQIAFPTAVHRGRARADNASYRPCVRWGGSMADTAGLESWLLKLAAELPEDACGQAHADEMAAH